MGFFKFLKKGKEEEEKDLTSEMTFEDIPPAPKPFQMEKKPGVFTPPRPPPELGIKEFPEVPKIKEEKENIEIPTLPETLGIEIRAPPTFEPKREKTKEERMFEEMPFPGIKPEEAFGAPEKREPVMPEISEKHKEIFAPPHEVPKPPRRELPPLEEQEEELMERGAIPPPPPLKPEKKEMIKPPVHEKPEMPVKEEAEEEVEFKYLKERTGVDFSKPLFLNANQCEVILDNINAMRRGLEGCDKSHDTLEEIRAKSDKQYQKLHSAVEDVQKKLFHIDKVLFNQ